MKNLVIVLVVIMSTTSVFGQDGERDQVRLEDHVMLKDGKMYRIHDRDQTELKEQLRLNDGTSVNPDGTIQMQDQKRIRLRDGECIDIEGNRYPSQQEFRQQLQSRAQAMAQEHLAYEGGQLFRIKNQEKAQIHERITLMNGTHVNPDGSIELKDRKRLQLRDGECLDLDGNRYSSQEQFHQQMQSRFLAMAQEHLILQNGQMYRIQNLEKSQLKEPLTLQNGSVVSPNGKVQMNDKKQFQLRDGECIDMEGKRYETQERFRDKMEQRNTERLNRGEKQKISSERKGGKRS